MKNLFCFKAVQAIFVSALISFCILWVGIASAEDRIAVVDVQRAILSTDYALKLEEESKEKPAIKENLEKLQALEEEVIELIQSYQNDLAVMSPEKKSEEERRIRDKQQDGQFLTKKLAEARKELQEQVVNELGPLVRDVLQEIVDADRITLLLRLESGAIIHHAPHYEITSKLTEKLNLAHKAQ